MKNLLFVLLIGFLWGCDEEESLRKEQTIIEIDSRFQADVDAFVLDAKDFGAPVKITNLKLQVLPYALRNDMWSRSYQEGAQWVVEINHYEGDCWRAAVYRELARVTLNKPYSCTIPDNLSMQNIMCEIYAPDCGYKNPSGVWDSERSLLFTGNP